MTPVSTRRLAMDFAFEEALDLVNAAPTKILLYRRYKDGERDNRLSLEQKAMLKSRYYERLKEEGWTW